jgi:hypothetical protein
MRFDLQRIFIGMLFIYLRTAIFAVLFKKSGDEKDFSTFSTEKKK